MKRGRKYGHVKIGGRKGVSNKLGDMKMHTGEPQPNLQVGVIVGAGRERAT